MAKLKSLEGYDHIRGGRIICFYCCLALCTLLLLVFFLFNVRPPGDKISLFHHDFLLSLCITFLLLLCSLNLKRDDILKGCYRSQVKKL